MALTAHVLGGDRDRGLTSEVALVVAGFLGALAVTSPGVAVALGVLVVGVLSEKERLHRFADIVTQTELEDGLRLFIAAFVVLPLLPERRFGPGGAIDPSKVFVAGGARFGLRFTTRLVAPAAVVAGGFLLTA